MEAILLETRGNNFSRLRSAQAFGIALVAGVAAFALEYVRVDPTFGVGVALWLFFPLIVLSLCGGFAAMGSAAVAVSGFWRSRIAERGFLSAMRRGCLSLFTPPKMM